MILLAMIASLALGVYFIESYHVQRQKQLDTITQYQAEQKAAEVASLFTLEVKKKSYSAYTLSNIIASEPLISQEHLTFIISGLIQHDKHLLGVAIAPQDAVNFVYPEVVFESDYTQDILQDISTLSNHIEEMKNNLDLLATAAVYQSDEYPDYYVVRSPIYSGTVGNRTYLGHVTLLVDLEQMLQDSHFNDRQFLVAAVNEAKPFQRVGDLQAIDSATIKTDINASNVDWQVFIAPDPDSNLPRWPLFNSVRLVGYVLLSMVFCGFAIILRLYFKARQRSMQDELTSLPNRRYFVYTLKSLVRNAKYTRTQFAVINLDLDGFKRINDEYGHASGDLLLKQVAKVLRGAVRATDVVARVGGDEFLIIASRITQESEVTKLVEGIQHKVESENYLVRGAMVKTQVSIGFSMYKDKQTTFDNLLSSADINMYKNKALKRKLMGLRQEEKEAANALENHD